MKLIRIFVALIFTLLSIGVQAAGSPITEDFSNVIALSKSAIEASKQADSTAFLEKTSVAMDAFKKQASNEKGYSLRLDRTAPKLRAALKAAKAGNIEVAVTSLEQAIKEMQN